MKKLLLIIFTAMLAILTACSSSDQASTDKKTDGAKKEEKSESVEVNKGLLNVEVTLPASMFEGEDIDSDIAEAEAKGIKVTKNEDGSVTYKMSKSKHKEMMKELETELVKSIDEMKNGEDFASIQDISHNKSFSEFTLTVDKAAYENSFDGFAVFGLGVSGMYYQLFNGVNADNYKVKILVKDVATGEVFDEIVYPDELEDTEE
jgi:major membrane immunogen (membrane-anchored lipoprotein)